MAASSRETIPQIFDTAAYRVRRARAAQKSSDLFLAEDATAHITERLTALNLMFDRAIDLGSRMRGPYAAFAREWTGSEATVDEMFSYEPGSFDLVVSVLALHAINDLPGVLTQIRRALKPGGLFMAALFGGETLNELRTSFAAAEAELTGGASPRVAPFADVRDLGALLQRAGFEKPVADVERTVVRYSDIFRLFTDLRALGETNALVGRRKNLLSRRLLSAMIGEYGARFAERGKLRATFDIVYLTGYAPDQSQSRSAGIRGASAGGMG
ncbi:MAG: methyltransferase domain-containing protein [Alphaproteobacteria bacterium]